MHVGACNYKFYPLIQNKCSPSLHPFLISSKFY